MSRMSRRFLLKASGLSFVGLATAPGFLARAAEVAPRSNKVLVTLFLRGGADGLSLVPPVGDPDYHLARPTLALQSPGSGENAVLRLDDTFGLHPGLAPLLPLWNDKALAVVHAAGLPQAVRSHFDAQDFMETGTPGVKSTHDGYLNRALEALPAEKASTFRAVALQPTLPRALVGTSPALALGALSEFRLRGSQSGTTTFAALYAGALDEALRTTGAEATEALSLVEGTRLASLPPANGAEYPRSPLGKRLQDIARLIRSDVGLQVAATEAGGWDTHVGQGAPGAFAARAKDLGDSLGAFARDLGPRLSDVLVVVMTEFGRTVKENGSRGTDHGTGGAMLVLGGGVRGGRVAGPWKGLARAHLLDERDVPTLTDYRAVLSEALVGHLGLRSTAPVFPGYEWPQGAGPRLLGA